MADQIRSADLLVTRALADPKILDGLKTAPEQTLKNLSNQVVQELPRLPEPSTSANNAIWLIVVASFSLVMLGAAYVLGAGVTTKLDAAATYAAKSDTILTLFTTATAFLAGLLSPSPIQK